MKIKIKFLALFLLTTQMLTAQCDSSSDVRQVFQALRIDDDLPFLKTSPLYLKPGLDSESLAIIKDGISRRYYVRQLTVNGRIVFDTLSIDAKERSELDSLLSKRSRKWTSKNVLPCRIDREVIIYQERSATQGVKKTTYQLMEPVFFRDRTLAFVYFEREVPSSYSEFDLFIKRNNRWELWDKIIITIGR